MAATVYTTIDGYTFTILDVNRYRVECSCGCVIADNVTLGRAYKKLFEHSQQHAGASVRVAPPTQTKAHMIK
jgi:transcription initiation factor TFIIIB Brf1 subunit/transcription initiation factor TFIIB